MLSFAISFRTSVSHLRHLLSPRVRQPRARRWVALGLGVLAVASLACLTGCSIITTNPPARALFLGFAPLAGVKYPGNLYPPASYFDGNSTTEGNDATDSSTTVAGFPGTVFARQPDCTVAGVTFSKVALTSMSGYTGTFSGTFTSTITPDYGNTLHSVSGLTTTSGIFAGGCTDKTAGMPFQPAALLAQTAAGVYVGAATDINNNLYVGAINPTNGTFSGTRLSVTNVFGLSVGDVNSEGVRQLIYESYMPSPTGGYAIDTLFTLNVHADGTPDTPVQITTPYPQFYLVVDDVNGDGKLDLIFCPQTYSSAQITVLPGVGNGTFGAPIASVTVTAGSQTPVTGDFNGDGKRDLLIGNVLFGNGDGTFTLGPAVPAANPIVGSVAIGDFNKDGKDDLAVYTPVGVSIYIGNGNGTFTAFGPTYAGIHGGFTLDVTDIDGDGNLDLVVGQGQSGIYVPPPNSEIGITSFLMGNGDGTFRGTPAYGHDTGSGLHGAFAAGDFNGDGNMDVLGIASNPLGDSVSGLQMLIGDGKGTLTPQTINTSVLPSFVVAADVTGDGKLDALTLSSTTDISGNNNLVFSVLNGKGDGTFAAPVSYPVASSAASSASYLALGDTRASGKLDAVINQGGSLYYLRNNGDGTFASAALIDTESGIQALTVADVNGDGKADIVAMSVVTSPSSINTTGSILVYLSHGDGTFAAPVTLASVANGQDMIVADVNKDSKPDILVLFSDPTSGLFSLNALLGHGDGTFAPAVSSPLNGQALVSLAAADVNGDGNPDILIGACCGSTLASIALGNGDGTFATNYGLSIGPSTNAVGFADLNNDGRPDLLLATNQTLVTSLNEFGSAIITKTPSTTSLTASPINPTAGQSVTFTATVAPSSGSGTPTGTVTFLDGTTSLGTGTLNAQGVATFATSTLAAGPHTITASYGGDGTFANSTSSAVSVTVNAVVTKVSTATGLSSSASPIISGQSVTFTATVTPSSGTAVPTGTVTFTDGSANLGTGILNAQGVATFATSSLSVGTQMITASYGGDSNFSTSTSSAVSVIVTAPVPADFSMGLSPSTGTVNGSGSVQTTITLTPSGGFTSAVALSCSGLPQYASCTFNPGSLTSDGVHATTSTLTIQTGVKTAVLKQPRLPGKGAGGEITLASLGGGGLLGLLILRSRRRTSKWWYVQLGLVSAFLAAGLIIGCGGSGSGATTPQGTSQITVTGAAGSTMHSTIYSLTVQ
jgi:hypothetical protein